MRASDLSPATWHKSSYSSGGSEQTNCVEVAELPGRVAMRDSKNPAGPILAFTHTEWRVFLGGMRGGELG